MGKLFSVGVDATSGRCLFEGLTLEHVARAAVGKRIDMAMLPDLMKQTRRISLGQTRAPIEGVDAAKLSETGWAVIFPTNADPAIREALAPLLALRRDQAGPLFRELGGDTGYRPGETKQSFLRTRSVAATGPVEPRKMPYYVLLAGGPGEIPFRFQYELGVQYAVGRIHFDTPDAYADYAAGVVAAEKGQVTVDRRAAFLGVANPGDDATRTTRRHLIEPLAQFVAREKPGWRVDPLVDEGARKRAVLEMLRQPRPPALLFTASHGMCYPAKHALQLPYQGSLVMQDWPGDDAPSLADHCFTADDVAGLQTSGMIAFEVACFGAATPDVNEFLDYAEGIPGWQPILAETPFLSALPKRLLANRALAVVGHIDTAFCTTFSEGATTATFESALKRLLEGARIGYAMDYFRLRHAELSVGLTAMIDNANRTGSKTSEAELALNWLQNNDARNYVVLGDPAVRMPLAADSAEDKQRIQRRIEELEQELSGLKQRLQAM